MKKNEIFIIPVSPQELTIILIDGSIADIYHNGEQFLTVYYQNRTNPKELRNDTEINNLAEGKQHIKDWGGSQLFITQNMVNDAVKWLNTSFVFKSSEIIFGNKKDIANYIDKNNKF